MLLQEIRRRMRVTNMGLERLLKDIKIAFLHSMVWHTRRPPSSCLQSRLSGAITSWTVAPTPSRRREMICTLKVCLWPGFPGPCSRRAPTL